MEVSACNDSLHLFLAWEVWIRVCAILAVGTSCRFNPLATNAKVLFLSSPLSLSRMYEILQSTSTTSLSGKVA